MATPDERFANGPVIIVGAGPVGLTLALRLHRSGVPVLVLDQKPDHPSDQRASTLQPGALALFDELGLLPRLHALGHQVRQMSWYSGLERSFTLRYDLIDRSTDYPYRLHLDQWTLCGVLEEQLPLGSVMWNRRVVGLEQLDDRVAVQLDDRTRLYGSFLVGADGLASTVRNLSKIPLETGDRDSFGTFYTGPGLADHLPSDEGCTYFHVGSHWTLVMRLRDGYRVLFSLPKKKTNRILTDPAALAERLRFPLASFDFDRIERRRAFSVQHRLASTFRKGRVLLAGDAAHLTFPADGTALNAGLIDAAILGRALTAPDLDDLYNYGHDRPTQLRPWVLPEVADPAGDAPQRWSPTAGVPTFGDDEDRRTVLFGVSSLGA